MLNDILFFGILIVVKIKEEKLKEVGLITTTTQQKTAKEPKTI